MEATPLTIAAAGGQVGSRVQIDRQSQRCGFGGENTAAGTTPMGREAARGERRWGRAVGTGAMTGAISIIITIKAIGVRKKLNVFTRGQSTR